MRSERSSATIRALLVDLSLRFGGASVRAAGLAQGARGMHWALAVLQDTPAHRHAQDLGLEVFVVGSRRTDPGIVQRLTRIVRDGGYQVLDGQNPPSKLWGAIAAWRARAAFVSTLNSWPLSEYGASLRGYAYTVLERLVRRRTNLHIAVSPQIRDLLLQDGVPANRIVTIPAAVEIDLQAIMADGARARRLLGLPPQARMCVAVGRLAEAKGYPFLLAAMGRLHDRFPDLHCLIVGEGKLAPVLRAEVERLRLSRQVHLLGFRSREETLSLLSISDLFVMPSLSEGTPMALLEAAALARPIVASAVGGIPSVFEDGLHARLVPPADADHLASAMAELLAKPDEARAMAGNAQRRVRERYGLAQQVQSTLEAYRLALLNQSGAAPRDQS